VVLRDQLEEQFDNLFEVVNYAGIHELQEQGVSLGPIEIFTPRSRLPALANTILWHLPYQMTGVDRGFHRVLPFPWRAIREICKQVEKHNKRRYNEEVIENRRIANAKTQQELYQAATTLQAFARRRSYSVYRIEVYNTKAKNPAYYLMPVFELEGFPLEDPSGYSFDRLYRSITKQVVDEFPFSFRSSKFVLHRRKVHSMQLKFPKYLRRKAFRAVHCLLTLGYPSTSYHEFKRSRRGTLDLSWGVSHPRFLTFLYRRSQGVL
jgi:hypothetical protein